MRCCSAAAAAAAAAAANHEVSELILLNSEVRCDARYKHLQQGGGGVRGMRGGEGRGGVMHRDEGLNCIGVAAAVAAAVIKHHVGLQV